MRHFNCLCRRERNGLHFPKYLYLLLDRKPSSLPPPDSLAKTLGIYPRNARVLLGRGSMLLASVPFGTRPYRRKSLCTDIVVREDRDAAETVEHVRPQQHRHGRAVLEQCRRMGKHGRVLKGGKMRKRILLLSLGSCRAWSGRARPIDVSAHLIFSVPLVFHIS